MPAADAPVLALDAASPRVSVAVGRAGAVLAQRAEDLERSSRRLLEMIDEVLREAGLVPGELGGLVALRGPGSFTGLRVGLATALGLHQALDLPATALSTLEVLASLAPPVAGGRRTPGAPDADLAAVGAVDVLRGEWAVQAWPPGGPRAGATPGAPEPPIRLLTPAGLASLAPCALVGFGVERLAREHGLPPDVHPVEPGPLAPAALALLAHLQESGARPLWDPTLLTAPLYLRPPAVTLPKPRAARTLEVAPERTR